MKQQLLLLQDVDSLGKKGELVTAKPGYVRNFLLPRGLAMVATKNAIRKQEQLRAERAKQAIIDRKESEALLVTIEATVLETRVKVDPEGRMYGSVSASDIAHLFEEKGVAVEKKSVLVTKPIKETGAHEITIKLKEGISAICKLNIIPEGVNVVKAAPEVLPVVEETVEEKTE